MRQTIAQTTTKTMFAVLLLGAMGSSQAVVTAYTSAASFASAVTGATVHGFNAIPIAAPPNDFVGGPQTVAGVTFSSNLAFTLPVGNAGTGYGVQFFSGQSGANLITATLAGTYAIAFNYGSYFNTANAPVTITLSTGDVFVQALSGTPNTVTTFAGFVSSTPITSVSFSASTATVFDVPSFILATPVPEAPTWAMLLLGAGVLGAQARRRLHRPQ
jgi:hypothetical protein